MLQLEHIRLELSEKETLLPQKAAAVLKIDPKEITSFRILRRAVDAREGIRLVYTLRVEVKNQTQVLRRCKSRHVSVVEEELYQLPQPLTEAVLPPVVVGAGPAGLFCALTLARCGAKPILLERGQPVEQRQKDVEIFWSGGDLDLQSNVQFGEGGAGAFSDGKLNTGTRDVRHRFLLEELVAHGAPESILADAKPHVGTDYLHRVLVNLRQELLQLGCDIRFGHQVTDIQIENNAVRSLHITAPEGEYDLPARQVVLALGNSARDTFAMLYRRGVAMEPKPFAVGVRIEHRQQDIDMVQYGEMAGHPRLGAASYKLSCHTESGRGVFSFCVCPGGVVVAAASEQQHQVTNGMSYYSRNGENCNGGLLVSVTPEDFPGTDPLAGLRLQQELEELAYAYGTADFSAPAQRVEDFLAHRPSTGAGRVKPTYRPGVVWGDLWQVLPEFICKALEEALPMLERKLKGFAAPDAVLTAVETRSSCPLRIPRGDDGQSVNVKGLYPCGEGAGYAGGILSAASDGLHTAELVLNACRGEKR